MNKPAQGPAPVHQVSVQPPRPVSGLVDTGVVVTDTSAPGPHQCEATLLPWEAGRSAGQPAGRGPALVEAARPLLIGALRRVFALPLPERTLYYDHETARWAVALGFCGEDLEALDGVRPTRNRLAHAALWNAHHPAQTRPFLHTLRHAAYVLTGVGLSPVAVHRTRCALALGPQVSDADLLACAHLSLSSVFEPPDLVRLRTDHGWTLPEFLHWSTHATRAHAHQCRTAGLGWTELGALTRAKAIPEPGQIEMLLAFTRPTRVS